jgi:RNA polymerase sigma factor (sigma-70 family)
VTLGGGGDFGEAEFEGRAAGSAGTGNGEARYYGSAAGPAAPGERPATPERFGPEISAIRGYDSRGFDAQVSHEIQRSNEAQRGDTPAGPDEAGPGEAFDPDAVETAAFFEDAPESEWTPPSWDEVVRTHSARVYRLAYRLTGDRHDAEDLTQEVFVRVFRSLSSYTPGTFEGWLHRITTNLFLDSVRRKAKIRFEGLADDAADRLPGSQPSPAQSYFDTHLDADIERALAALAPEFRAAVVLCDIEGLSYEEIAATLGIKLGTVRSRIHRGRSQLRAALAHRAPAAQRAGDRNRAAAAHEPEPAGILPPAFEPEEDPNERTLGGMGSR